MFKNMGGNISGGNFLGGNFPGGNLVGGNFPGGNFRGGSFPDTYYDYTNRYLSKHLTTSLKPTLDLDLFFPSASTIPACSL